MIIVVCKHLFIKNYCGMAIWPFIFIKYAALKNERTFINHEKIHLIQQKELFIIPFYIWYLIEYFIKYIKFKNHNKAYLNISFEKEAYLNDKNLNYLKERKTWAFLKHL